MVAVVESGDLKGFSLEELSEFWSAFMICRDDKKFYAQFSAQEKKEIIAALNKVETELKSRKYEPVNFFQMMQDNPERVVYYLQKFSTDNLLTLERDLQEFRKSKIIADFLKLVRQEIYKRVPVS